MAVGICVELLVTAGGSTGLLVMIISNLVAQKPRLRECND